MSPKFALTRSDKTSQTWLKLVEHLEERREFYRVQLESDTTEVAAAKLRGRIAFIKELISLGDEDRSTG